MTGQPRSAAMFQDGPYGLRAALRFHVGCVALLVLLLLPRAGDASIVADVDGDVAAQGSLLSATDLLPDPRGFSGDAQADSAHPPLSHQWLWALAMPTSPVDLPDAVPAEGALGHTFFRITPLAVPDIFLGASGAAMPLPQTVTSLTEAQPLLTGGYAPWVLSLAAACATGGIYFLQLRRRHRLARAARARRHIPIVDARSRSRRRKSRGTAGGSETATRRRKSSDRGPAQRGSAASHKSAASAPAKRRRKKSSGGSSRRRRRSGSLGTRGSRGTSRGSH
jgi:hypothetical protein